MEKRTTTSLRSEFFTLAELTKSATAMRLKINNTPNADIIRNLQYGVDMILDPARRIYGKPIIITSAYRCPLLNQAVGGVKNSWHQRGCAADIHVEDEKDARIKFDILSSLPSVDTVLFEHSQHSEWLHVQWDMNITPRHHYNFNYKA